MANAVIDVGLAAAPVEANGAVAGVATRLEHLGGGRSEGLKSEILILLSLV